MVGTFKEVGSEVTCMIYADFFYILLLFIENAQFNDSFKNFVDLKFFDEN